MLSIIDDLGKDHGRFRRYLCAYRAEIRKLSEGSGADFGLLEQLALYFSQYPDELHHKKEDIIYARLALKMKDARIKLVNLHAEHEDLSHHAHHFSDIVTHVLNDAEIPIANIIAAAEKYDAILTGHMEREEEALFAPARDIFKDNDWGFINDRIGELYAQEINFGKARHILDVENLLDKFLTN